MIIDDIDPIVGFIVPGVNYKYHNEKKNVCKQQGYNTISYIVNIY